MKETENASWSERLSALADGEADPADTAQLAARWRDDASLRLRWQDWHLIGDVMRSDELVGRGRESHFLENLRERLAAEPVVLAPAPVVETPAASRRRAGLRWRAPAAVAAGFVMVAGALVVMRPAGQDAEPKVAVRQEPVTAPAAAVPPAALPPAGSVAVAQPRPLAEPMRGVLVRDARMQQYFDAHQQFGGSTALGMPSSFLRNATYDTPTAESGTR